MKGVVLLRFADADPVAVVQRIVELRAELAIDLDARFFSVAFTLLLLSLRLERSQSRSVASPRTV